MAPKFRDPFPVYRNGEMQMVHGVDFPGWAAQGWGLEPGASVSTPEPEPVPVVVTADPQFNQPHPYTQREQELQALLKESWQNIKRICVELAIAKPAGGWDDAIPLILAKEGLTPPER